MNCISIIEKKMHRRA